MLFVLDQRYSLSIQENSEVEQIDKMNAICVDQGDLLFVQKKSNRGKSK